MNKFLELLYIELKTVPFTLAVLLVLWVIVGRLANDHVSVAEFESLKHQIEDVASTLKADHLDTRLHNTQKESYEIAQHIRDLQDRHLPVDEMILRRQEILREDEEELKRLMRSAQ